MPAANTDKLRKGTPVFSTQLGASISSSETTILLDSVTDLPLDTAICLVIDATDANGNLTPNAKEVVLGVVDSGSSSLTNCLRGLDQTTAQSHNSGAQVVQWFVAADWNSLIDNILTHANQDGSLKASAVTTAVGSQLVPTGVVMPFASGTLPASGWLFCNGQAVSRSTYSDLFGIIGTTYGTGDGTSTFNLPDLRTRVPAGYSSGDSTFGTLGNTGGETSHTLTVNEMPAHHHGTVSGGTGGTSYATGGAGNPFLNTTTTFDTGGGAAHNNLQPYITLNYIIKT